MEKFSITSIARNQLEAARASKSGRAAHTVYGGSAHVLRQTVIAMLAGTKLDEHENPGEATIQVLSGRIVLSSAQRSWEASDGGMLIIPKGRQSVAALEDSVVILTVAKLAHTSRLAE